MKRTAWANLSPFSICNCRKLIPLIEINSPNESYMNLRARLSERVHIEDIREVLHFIQDDERLREEIYQLIFDEDAIVSYQALWVCTHFSKADVEWLSRKQEELIDAAMTCPHSGKRRMIPEPDMPATCRRSATSGFP